jgi:hypothetical protein
VTLEILYKIVVEEEDPLGACAPDVPAILLSLTASYCPSRNYLINPLVSPTPPGSNLIPCKVRGKAARDTSTGQRAPQAAV